MMSWRYYWREPTKSGRPVCFERLDGGCLLYRLPRVTTSATEIATAGFDEAAVKRARRKRITHKDARKEAMGMMPFGKYRGAPLDALVDDAPYAEWLLGQRWFGEKFPQQRRYLVNKLCRTRDAAEGPNAA
jgi:uncharacterized protein (DUF3820 family)